LINLDLQKYRDAKSYPKNTIPVFDLFAFIPKYFSINKLGNQAQKM